MTVRPNKNDTVNLEVILFSPKKTTTKNLRFHMMLVRYYEKKKKIVPYCRYTEK